MPTSVPPHRADLWRTPVALLSLVALLALATSCSADGGDADATVSPAGGPVEVYVRWEVPADFPATITIHEPPPGQDLYEVRTYAPGEVGEVGEAIPDGLLHAEYSEPRRFIARLRNESAEAVRFWVAPHLPVPHVSEQGLMMFCLCTGEVYEVPAGGTWTRVMEFGVTRRAGLEGPLTLVHVLVRGELPVAGLGSAAPGDRAATR